MRAKQLQKKYPEFWDYVYHGVLQDLLECMNQVDVEQWRNKNKYNRLDRIAHNASFIACSYMNKNKLKEV